MKKYVKPIISSRMQVQGIFPIAAAAAAIGSAASAAAGAVASVAASEAFVAGTTAGAAYAMGHRDIYSRKRLSFIQK